MKNSKSKGPHVIVLLPFMMGIVVILFTGVGLITNAGTVDPCRTQPPLSDIVAEALTGGAVVLLAVALFILVVVIGNYIWPKSATL